MTGDIFSETFSIRNIRRWISPKNNIQTTEIILFILAPEDGDRNNPRNVGYYNNFILRCDRHCVVALEASDHVSVFMRRV
jgi:hypothetical protein